MEPFGGILRPSIGSDRIFDVFVTVAAEELLLSHWRIEVRPNGVEMAQNFMRTSFLAILKNLVVFV